jgi:PAS domain S-box-containing protein
VDLRILYLEDNPVDADLAARELSRHDAAWTVELVRSLAEARARLAASPAFDLLLSDMRLPDGTGLELLAEVRERGLPLAVVMLTGTGDEATAIAALKAGADDYVLKGADHFARLPFTLEAALDRFRNEEARRSAPMRVLFGGHHVAEVDRTRRHLESHAPHVRLEAVGTSGEVTSRLPSASGQGWDWDVLLLDMELPDATALGILKTLRAERRLDIPAVVVGGAGDEETVVQALRLGATDYLVKYPGYLHALPAVLENALSRVLLTREQSALRDSESRLSAIISSAMDAVVAVDEAQHIVLLNPAAERMFGWPHAEAVGKPLDEFIPPRFRWRHREHVSDFAREGTTSRMTGMSGGVFGVRRSGEEFPIEASISRSRVGGTDLYTVIVRDVTDRLLQVQRLRDSEERFRQLAENIQEVFWMSDPAKSQILYVSPVYEKIWGRPPASLYADARNWIAAIHPEDRDRVIQAALTRQASGEYDEEYRVVRPDGTQRRIHDRAFPVRNEVGEVYRIVGVAEDVTARRAAEEERRHLEQQLLQSQKMEAVGRLAGGVAHDFNNMLNVILANTELGLKKPGAGIARRLEEIQTAALRSADLTRQLLAFSRLQTIAPRRLHLSGHLEGMKRLLQRIIGEDIDLRFILPPDLWPVFMDASQVDQVLANLAINARDAMPDGGALTIEAENVVADRVYCQRIPDATPGEYVVLAVSDNGVGMDRATLQRAFEPFFTTKPEGKGTGLGLATVYGVARQNGGFAHIYSEVGRGTTVKFYVPRHRGESDSPAVPAAARERAPGQGIVLLVEDEASLRDISAELLGELGYTVLTAAGPDEALEQCRQHAGPLDLLLTDVVMPSMNGKELADRIKEIKPGVRVLFMSGYTANAIAHHGVLDADVPYLQKPFLLEALAAKIEELLGKR